LLVEMRTLESSDLERCHVPFPFI
jgi:hypothetical protein